MAQRVAAASGARIIELLLTIAESKHPLSARELAERMRLPLSTIYRYLSVLRAQGLVWSVGNGHYAVGPRVVQLARSFEETFSVAAVCRPVMQRLARETQETVAFVVPVGERAVCVETVESTQALRYSFTRGAVLPLLRGASAKALLPYLPRTRVERAMSQAGLDEEAQAALWDDIARIAARGYAESEGEVDTGVWAVGVPVFGPSDELLGALSVIAPVARLTPERRAALIQRAIAAADQLTTLVQGETLVHQAGSDYARRI
ncbi:MAG: IclR family transcriptional regulator [Thermorudis peleae]|nr:IclR family transcriptional regulator [Thermorudis peleae]